MNEHEKIQQQYWDTLAQSVPDRVAASHWVDQNSRAVDKQMFAEIATYLHTEFTSSPEVRDALEIGCGNGLILAELARLIQPQQRLHGLDISAEMLKRASLPPNITLHQGDASHLPFPDGSLDFIFMHSVTQYFGSEQYMRRCLAECLRCLRKGGSLVLLDVSVSWYRELMISNSFWKKIQRKLTQFLRTGRVLSSRRVHERLGNTQIELPQFTGYYANPDLYYEYRDRFRIVQIEVQPFQHKPLVYRKFRFNVRLTGKTD
jgi:ubiquinone/menaquinone biosynthesis C-methylase UbiE